MRKFSKSRPIYSWCNSNKCQIDNIRSFCTSLSENALYGITVISFVWVVFRVIFIPLIPPGTNPLCSCLLLQQLLSTAETKHCERPNDEVVNKRIWWFQICEWNSSLFLLGIRGVKMNEDFAKIFPIPNIAIHWSLFQRTSSVGNWKLSENLFF